MPQRRTPVTVITPSLDQRRYVKASIASVADQAYPQIEHIVIDGGSTDGTLDILGGVGPRIRWTSGPDAGMYDAINRGLAMATGEIVGYLNSDDAYFPWAVESVVAAFEARPELDILYGDGVRVDEATGEQELRLLAPFDRVALAHSGSLLQPAVFWRRRLTDRIGTFDSRLRFVGDLDFWLRASEAGKVGHLEEVIAIDRIHPGALSQARSHEMAIEERAMRAAHGADLDTAAGRRMRAWAIRRDKTWSRRTWVRFVGAAMQSSRSRPWDRFLSNGDCRISRPSILLGQLPRIGYPLLRRAVHSGLAEQILRG